MPPPPRTLGEWMSRQLALRPAVAVAAGLMAGICLHGLLPVIPWFWGVAVVACCLAAVVERRNGPAASLLLAMAVLLCGVALAQVSRHRFPDSHIAHFARDEPRLAQLELYIANAPRVLSDPFSIGRALPPRQVCVAEVRKVRTWDGWIDASGGILVQIDQPHPRLAINQTVRVLGMLQRPSPSMNPGQFDWADCALADGVGVVRDAFWARAGLCCTRK